MASLTASASGEENNHNNHSVATPTTTPPNKKTTTKLSTASDKQRSGADRRLVEYFVVVSSVEQKKKESDNTNEANASGKGGGNGGGGGGGDGGPEWRTEGQQPSIRGGVAEHRNNYDDYDDDEDEFSQLYFRPTITARYPLHDHADNPLHESLTFFCYPGGSIQLRTEPFMPKVHYFVATGGTGRQIYGTCLKVWEPAKVQVPAKRNKKKNRRTYGDQVYGADYHYEEQEEEPEQGDDQPPELEERLVYVPKCLVILSSYPYLVAFREYLVQLLRLTKQGDMVLPVERYIVNFCAEIPAPPAGALEVQTCLGNSTIKLWTPPHNLPTAWVSLPFGLLFECLDIDNIVTVWHCLVLERQVLITSTQLSILTIACEVLLSLLFPLQWSHAYIPVLPHFLIPILSAPMPFLCGIHKVNLADALYDLSRECCLVDLDKNLVTLGPDTAPLPPLPPACAAALSQELESQVGMVFREARSLTKHDDYSNHGERLPMHVKLMAEAMWESKLCLMDEAFHLVYTEEQARKNILNGNDASGMDSSEGDHARAAAAAGVGGADRKRKQSCWDAVQEAFLDTAVYLLRNYRKYLVFPSKHNEGSYGGAGFRSKEFLEGQRFDMREVLAQLIGTQMFDNFITKRLYGSGAADVAFFDRAVDRFLKQKGMFADVDLSGRLADMAADRFGNKNSGGSGNAGAGAGGGGMSSTALSSSRGGTIAQWGASRPVKNQDPLLQSARVHRKLKTIVPPEPSGEGLPPRLPVLDGSATTTSSGLVGDGMVRIPLDGASASATATDDDASSVQSSSTQGSSSKRRSTRPASTNSPASVSSSSNYRRTLQSEILEKKRAACYTYPTFPSTFNAEWFGQPRPLPAAVIAEFDRQRKDAAQFRRKSHNNKKRAGGAGEKKGHISRAAKNNSSAAAADSVAAPPSAEVATFTVFFMAFCSMVGKELVDMARQKSPNGNNGADGGGERTILSTYVSSRSMEEEEQEPPSDVEDADTDTGSVDTGTMEDVDIVDPADQEGVNNMKASRPTGMFGDDEDDNGGYDDAVQGLMTSLTVNGAYGERESQGENGPPQVEKEEKQAEDTIAGRGTSSTKTQSTASTTNTKSTSTAAKSNGSGSSSPRKRFRDKLSDMEMDEAKATGRAQLALAFEMLTMMKKRALKADPEAYQSLIDACGRVGDTKRATDLLARMHEDGIVADGTVYACLVSAFSADSTWAGKKNGPRGGAGGGNSGAASEDLPEWANSTAVEMDWNKLQKRSLLDRIVGKVVDLDGDDGDDDEQLQAQGGEGGSATIRKLRQRLLARHRDVAKGLGRSNNNNKNDAGHHNNNKQEETGMEFFVTEAVERQIALGENLLEIVFPDISVDTENEVCPRCQKELSDDEVVDGWTAGNANDYTTACPNCTQRFVPHFCVQCTAPSFMGSKGPASPLLCERLSPWVLQKEIRSVMRASDEATEEDEHLLLSPSWRTKEYKNSVLWWNLVLSCMRYRFPFTFLLQGSFEQNLIAPMPEDEA